MKELLVRLGLPLITPALSRLHALKDVCKGQDCYLIGDGASVKWFDLEAFSDKPSIPCGYLPMHNDFHKLDTKYLLLIEPWWFFPFQKTTNPPVIYVRNAVQKVYREYALEAHPDKILITNITNLPVLNRKNTFYTFRDINDERLPNDFISHRMDCYKGSLRASILMAIYLGFDHCYMIGYDYTHFPSLSGHWYEKGDGVPRELVDYEKEFLSLAQEYIDITNITCHASSTTLNSVTYKEFTDREPVYRENHELLSAHAMEKLSCWPGYTIY